MNKLDQINMIPPVEDPEIKEEQDNQVEDAINKEDIKDIPQEIQELIKNDKSATLKHVHEFEKNFSLLKKTLQERNIERWTKDSDNITLKEINENIKEIIAIRMDDENWEQSLEKPRECFHVSQEDVKVGDYVTPNGGELHYSNDITKLYPAAGARFLYIVEPSDGRTDKLTNRNLGWKTSRAGLKVLQKIALNDETKSKLNWSFAKNFSVDGYDPEKHR